jgi:uncharacterized protein YqeY
MLKDRLTQDLKTAMLAKDAGRVSVLRSLKSAITYAEVASGGRGSELDDTAIIEVFTKEAKKRQESADSFASAGREEQAATERAEKAIIEEYLPRELDESELRGLVEAAVAELDDVSPKAMGQVIAAVKSKASGRVDGGLLARITKERLSQ